MPDDARPAAPDALPLRRFTRAEFDDMVARGVFREGEKVELIGGVITSMMGEGFPHAGAVDFLADALQSVLPSNLRIRVRTRLDIGGESETYPDILVEAAGTLPALRSTANVYLIVEVSHSSLAYDRDIKAAEYAAAGFAEYWILDIEGRRLIVHRKPSGGEWTSIETLAEGVAAPLFAPDRAVSIAAALPPIGGD